jgi:hypothetical protein
MKRSEHGERFGAGLAGIMCPCCGSDSREEGQLFSVYGVSFKPVNAKLYSPGPGIMAHAREDCGYLSFFVDTGKLGRCARNSDSE